MAEEYVYPFLAHVDLIYVTSFRSELGWRVNVDPAAAGSSSFNATDTRTMILGKVTSLVREGTKCVSEALYTPHG